MKSVLAMSVKSLDRKTIKKSGEDRYVAEVECEGGEIKKMWMSIKQGEKLQTCNEALIAQGGVSCKDIELHLILKESHEYGDDFVWAGVHTPKKSDLAWLEKQYGVNIKSPYVGRHDLTAPAAAAA